MQHSSIKNPLHATDAEQVSIIGVFYGGQDYETILQDDAEDGQDHWAFLACFIFRFLRRPMEQVCPT
jgi:hypothetical protein